MIGNIDFEIYGIGPIEKSKFKIRNINIFYGPNNSGKSIIAKLIHGFYLEHEIDKLDDRIFQVKIDEAPSKNNVVLPIKIDAFRHINPDISKIITFKRDKFNVSISIVLKKKRIRFHREFNRDDKMEIEGKNAEEDNVVQKRPSLYIHAARLGILHTLDVIIAVMYRTKEFPREFFDNNFSDIIESILWFRLKNSTKFDSFFKRLFSGSIEQSSGVKSFGLRYIDKSGYSTGLLEVGSGIQTTFPILISMERLSKNGLLVIEEPESHLEPYTLLRLTEMLFQFTKENKGKLIITTHSEWLIKKFQSLVSEGNLSTKDISILKFNRKETFTKIQDITIDQNGFTEEEFYEDAQESL